MISFIIPVYNKGPVLYKTLSSLIRHLKKSLISDFEIIVVNDGSTDDSLTQAIKFREFNGATDKIKIYNYQKNVGKGFALRYGFYKSSGDPIVFLDGDQDIDTRYVITALHTFDRLYPDAVIGSKYHVQSRVHYPPLRFVYSFVLKQVIRVLFNFALSDTQVGLKVYRRSVLSEVFPKIVIKRFAVDLEMLIVAKILGYQKFVESPVVINHSTANKSSINMFAVKNFCQDIAAIWYRKNILHYYETQESELPQPTFIVQSV